MNDPVRVITRERHADVLEAALNALMVLMADRRFDLDTRLACGRLHARLHACRDAQTVARMEQQRGLRE